MRKDINRLFEETVCTMIMAGAVDEKKKHDKALLLRGGGSMSVIILFNSRCYVKHESMDDLW